MKGNTGQAPITTNSTDKGTQNTANTHMNTCAPFSVLERWGRSSVRNRQASGSWVTSGALMRIMIASPLYLDKKFPTLGGS